jgi:hypothetical protein
MHYDSLKLGRTSWMLAESGVILPHQDHPQDRSCFIPSSSYAGVVGAIEIERESASNLTLVHSGCIWGH